MEPILCQVGAGTRCEYKRNAKPYTACAYQGECSSKKVITVQSHGQELYDQIGRMK